MAEWGQADGMSAKEGPCQKARAGQGRVTWVKPEPLPAENPKYGTSGGRALSAGANPRSPGERRSRGSSCPA